VSPQFSLKLKPFRRAHQGDENVTFVCRTRGGPNNMYEWYKNPGGAVVGNGPTLVLFNISAVDGGVYTCNVSNLAGFGEATVLFSGKLI